MNLFRAGSGELLETFTTGNNAVKYVCEDFWVCIIKFSDIF